ncbi:hypothetical protein [Crenalkalicoccus roseus]|uniref:hypothetical protein n=1 Tax=Crenalkalicoccus roseus TaxID=1485588 RepID=UPI001080226A|nr:hypothetical protein [Crenalkalicoccus roseus]
MRPMPPGYIANFDSGSAMLRATARFLKGKDIPALGLPRPLKRVVPLANLLPRRAREALYAVGGVGEAILERNTDNVDSEALARWATGLYPQRPYPAVVVGSASGALVHLCCALGLPWLPQTLFIPVRQTEVHPDDAKEGLESGLEPGRRLLAHNPDLQLHHMHDPNQDRLMLHLMTYFRVKRLRLGPAYEAFLQRVLPPGGTIIVSDCRRRFPVTRLSDRHVFQFGALGGATPEEFLHGGPRVEEYLARYGSHRRRWDPPAPTEEAPEAEWGFEPRLGEDIERFAAAHGYRVARIVFDEPEDPSPLVAELYRWWYRERRIPASRLLIESFILLDPLLALRTGSAPFWMKFNMEPSAEAAERYLRAAEPFDEINLTLFAHGVECVGLPPIGRWRRLLGHARRAGRFLGVDEREYPRDFAVLTRFHDALERLPARYPIPGPLGIGRFLDFLDRHGHRFPEVRFHGLEAAAGASRRAA